MAPKLPASPPVEEESDQDNNNLIPGARPHKDGDNESLELEGNQTSEAEEGLECAVVGSSSSKGLNAEPPGVPVTSFPCTALPSDPNALVTEVRSPMMS